MKQTNRVFASVKKFFSSLGRPIGRVINRFPLGSFMGLMAVLLATIVIGNQLRKPQPTPPAAQPEPEKVQVYQLGGTPEVKVQAVIEKSGVIKLVAQTAGVVQKIRVTENDHVNRGTVLFSLSTNYQGGNAASITRKISQKNYWFLKSTYDTQLQNIQASRDIATKSETQQAELRAIARQSLDDTKSLITLNEDVLKGLDEYIAYLETQPSSASNSYQITQTKAQKTQILGVLNGLKSGLRNTEYLNSETEEPAEIARLLRDNTLRQLDIQEKSLKLNKDLAALNVKLAQIAESLMYPASPCPGTVERIHVKVGQMVTPGTVLATIQGDDNTATAVALVPGEVAMQVPPFMSSTIYYQDQKIIVQPRSISGEPTDGNLHSILFSLPEDLAPLLSNGSYIEVGLPIGPGWEASTTTYVPLDAIYHSQAGAFVYVVDTTQQPAVTKNQAVELGEVYGHYVEVKSGLSGTETIVTSRSVVEGEPVVWK